MIKLNKRIKISITASLAVAAVLIFVFLEEDDSCTGCIECKYETRTERVYISDYEVDSRSFGDQITFTFSHLDNLYDINVDSRKLEYDSIFVDTSTILDSNTQFELTANFITQGNCKPITFERITALINHETTD